MKSRVILSIVLVALGSIFAIIPQKNNKSGKPDVKELLLQVCDRSFLISTDEVAKIIIAGDPSIQLVDLRNVEDYLKYSLTGAINIPFDSLLSENYFYLIDNNAKKYVFYSNGTNLASQALIIARQQGAKNNLVMKGGLNLWFETIIYPTEPKSTNSSQEYNLYLTRLAAKEFFTGSKKSNDTESPNQAVFNKNIIKKKKQTVQGGCS